MKNKNYIVYIENDNLEIGYIKNICNCDKCKERGVAEIFINNLDDSYLNCIKYTDGFKYFDELIYLGTDFQLAIASIQEYYTNKINTQKLENTYLQLLIELANKEMLKKTMSTQIIGIDLSTLKDHSCINSICSNCKHIIENKIYKPEINDCEFTIYKRCPYCGIKFEKHIINE